MDIPMHIVNKLIKVNKNAKQSRELMDYVEEWLENKGVDISKLRQSSLSALEQAEYAELPSYEPNELKQLLLENIYETQG